MPPIEKSNRLIDRLWIAAANSSWKKRMHPRSTRLALLVATVLLAWPGRSLAATASLCKEVVQTIQHPAETRLEAVRKPLNCSKKSICCNESWRMVPECYDMQTKIVKAAWTETKTSYDCQDATMTPQRALNLFLENLAAPKPGFHIIPSELKALFAREVAKAYQKAQSIPVDIQNKLREMLRARPDRYGFTETDLANVRALPDKQHHQSPHTLHCLTFLIIVAQARVA